MKSSLYMALILSVVVAGSLHMDLKAQPGNAGISMTIYPVVRGADGNQYLITPSGKQVTVPGLGIAQNATQVSVYRDQANHFWYTNLSGQQVAVTPEQLEVAQAQINAQSTNGAMPPQMMPPAQSFYSSSPSYAAGFHGIPYGTPMNIAGPGQYSYTAPGGNQQFVTPPPQMSGQMNQWQQQVPFGQQPNGANMQGAAQMQGSVQQAKNGQSRMEMRREHRAERLEHRAQNQASNAATDQNYADSKMQSGQTLGTGFRGRRSAREVRRAKREEKRADFLNGNGQ